LTFRKKSEGTKRGTRDQSPRGRGGRFEGTGRRHFRDASLRRSEGAPSDRSAPALKKDATAQSVDSENMLYGINPILEALKVKPTRLLRILVVKDSLNPRVADDLVKKARLANVRVDVAERSVMPEGVHQGVAAYVRPYAYYDLPALIRHAKESGRAPLLVLLDSIQDPHNLGAIIRSAHAFGAQGVVVPKNRAAQVTGLVAKSSAGAVEHLPIAQVVNLSRAIELLKAAGFWIAVADPSAKKSLWETELSGPLGLVVGSEGPGVRDGVLNHCDLKVSIPMVGRVASLNASVSAAVMLAEVARQRAKQSTSKPVTRISVDEA
jgi:23S rRNA (guanosine2251-2'-O)-methyltransferase